MSSILLHDKTAQDITAYLSRPAHALALLGDEGVGKTYVAQHIAAQLLDVSLEHVQSHPYVRMLSPDEKGSIKIEAAKEIIGLLRLKTTGQATIRRVIIIEHADAMTTDAQNTMLKAIEEPPEDTVFILTIANRAAVLPTILSRVQSLYVHTPLESQIIDFFGSADTASVKRTYLLSGGKPGLIHALLQNDTEHPLVQAIDKAKQILGQDAFTRLVAIDEITKNKDSIRIVQAMQQIARTAIRLSSSDDTKTKAIQRWTTVLNESHRAEEYLAKNGQPKLVLTNLFLHV